NERQSEYVVCAPIMAASGRMLGVLVVRDMPFLALNFDNLQFLLVLLNYYADGIDQRELAKPIQDEMPHCPYEFAVELGRMARMKKASGIRSSLIGLVFPDGAMGTALLEH